MRRIEHFIGGRTTAASSRRTSPVFDPALGIEQAEVLLAEPADVDEAVGCAANAFAGWSTSSLSTRTKVLFSFRELVNAHLDELAAAVCSEHGKVLSDARGEVQRGLEVVEFACGIPQLLKGQYSDQVSSGVDVFSYRQPLGVVACITPFNFPVMVPMWMFPIAIACGNTVVLKPSERDPSPSMLLAELWREAGLPEGVFNVLNGDRVAVEALCRHEKVAAVSFVGSTPIARAVYSWASATGKRVQALGGAKNHAVVLPDAAPDYAAAHVSAAAFGSAGERCMAISAAVAVGPSADAFVEAVAELASAIRVGPGQDHASEMGPVITKAARDRIVGYIERATPAGVKVALDGRDLVVPGHEDGFFVGPTILDHVGTDMEVYRDEIFGPVLSVLRVESVEEAIALINANPYGNGTAIFTSSGEAARRFHREVRVGMIGVNVPIPVPMAYYSFGGWKDSLYGERRMHGEEGVGFYTRQKVVTERWPRPSGSGAASYHFPTAD